MISTLKVKGKFFVDFPGKRDFSAQRVVRVGLLLSPGLFAFYFVASFFYISGAYFTDAGWFNYSLCKTWGQMPPLQAELWNAKSIFYLHGFYTPTLMCHISSQVFGNSILGFSLIIALGSASVALLGYKITEQILVSKWYRAFFGSMLGWSSFALGSVTYPHPEALSGGLAGLGLLLFLQDRNFLGLLLLVSSVASREDIGLHLVVVALTLLVVKPTFNASMKTKLKKIILIGASGAFLQLVLSRILFKSTGALLKTTYIGSPAFEILSDPLGLLNRVAYWITANPGILGLFLCLALAFSITKEKIFLVPIFASIPWILVNLLAVDSSKQSLGLYNTFAFCIYLSPLGLIRMSEKNGLNNLKKNGSLVSILMIGMAAWVAMFSAVSVSPSGSGGSINATFRAQALSPNALQISVKQSQVIEKFLMENDNSAIDSGVASLVPIFQAKYFLGKKQSTQYDSLIYFRNYVLESSQRETFIKENSLDITLCSTVSSLTISTSDLEVKNYFVSHNFQSCK
jgi:hypothetical protein